MIQFQPIGIIFCVIGLIQRQMKPESREKVLVVVDCFDVPVTEKQAMQSAIEVGLQDEHPLIFINDLHNR